MQITEYWVFSLKKSWILAKWLVRECALKLQSWNKEWEGVGVGGLTIVEGEEEKERLKSAAESAITYSVIIGWLTAAGIGRRRSSSWRFLILVARAPSVLRVITDPPECHTYLMLWRGALRLVSCSRAYWSWLSGKEIEIGRVLSLVRISPFTSFPWRRLASTSLRATECE